MRRCAGPLYKGSCLQKFASFESSSLCAPLDTRQTSIHASAFRLSGDNFNLQVAFEGVTRFEDRYRLPYGEQQQFPCSHFIDELTQLGSGLVGSALECISSCQVSLGPSRADDAWVRCLPADCKYAKTRQECSELYHLLWIEAGPRLSSELGFLCESNLL